MLERLTVAPAQVKARNISENLLNDIRQILFCLYRAREITKTVYKKYNKFNIVIKQNGKYIYEF